MRILGILGSLSLFLSVAFGAFAAHAIKSTLSTRMLEVFDTGVKYQLAHSITILITALLADRGAAFRYAGALYLAGIILFSFSLYALSLTSLSWLGMITPLGGLAFLAGHLLLCAGFWRLNSKT